jgi:hypothetical protein
MAWLKLFVADPYRGVQMFCVHRPCNLTARGVVAGVVMAASLAGCAPSPTTSPSASSSGTPARNPAAFVEAQPYAQDIDPADFSDPTPNPYFPLEPGILTVFEGGDERVEVTVTQETKVILGVTATVITDQVFVDGALAEDTIDWYATDNLGNVWYFGEQTAEYENGEITTTAGSWEAGMNGAQPGIIMLADPQIGDTYRQEFYAGEAEDLAEVYALGETVDVPYGSYQDVLVTEDWTPLEPEVHERKWYVPDIGVVFEEIVQGGSGTLSLVEIRQVDS